MSRYPGLQQAANKIMGKVPKANPERQQSLINQNLPMLAEDCKLFAEWILTIADAQPILFKSEKK